MRAVVQRVSSAAVSVDGRICGSIDRGIAVLLGVAVDDDERDATSMAEKLANLRLFSDEAELMNRSTLEVGGSVLLISQFTLLGDARKGRRPSFITAAREETAKPLYERVGRLLEDVGLPVAYGSFGATMSVQILNEGPVTILIDTKKSF